MQMSVEEIYQQHIKPLPPVERLRLVARMTSDLAEENGGSKKRSIMELHGLGAEIWTGIEAEQYVNELRDEWEPRS